MLSCNELLNLKEDSLVTYFEDMSIEDFLEPILIRFPDYYNLRGQDIKQISDSEKAKVTEILVAEMM